MTMTMAYLLVLTLLISSLQYVHSSSLVQEKCGRVEGASREANIRLMTYRNESGSWHTRFKVRTDETDVRQREGVILDLKQLVVKCGEKEYVEISGLLGHENISDSSSLKRENTEEDNLYFEKGGSLVEFSNNRRTVTRKNAESDCCEGVAIINRPLKKNELFEVKLDKVLTKWSEGINLGVTTKTPQDIVFGNYLPNTKGGTLAYSKNHVFYDGSSIQANYGLKLQELKVGDRVGVMQKEDGAIHFFVNGVDQGSVQKKVYGAVYALVDVYTNAIQVTMVNPPGKGKI